MADAKQVLEWAKTGDVKQTVTQARAEATRRGHGKQTTLAGAGGLLGGVLGSFRGPLGAAVGALLGALLGAILGQRKDRALLEASGPVVRRGPKLPVRRSGKVIRVPRRPEREFVEVVYSD